MAFLAQYAGILLIPKLSDSICLKSENTHSVEIKALQED